MPTVHVTMGPNHPECPERLGAINDLLLVKGLLDYEHLRRRWLPGSSYRAHTTSYVNELTDASPLRVTTGLILIPR